MDGKLTHNPDRADSDAPRKNSTSPAWQDVNEDDLIGSGTLIHAAGSMTNADTYLVGHGDEVAVLKTFRKRALIMRIAFTRKTLHHEYEAMIQLQDLPGVPKVYGYAGKDSMLMEYIGGAGHLQDSRELTPESYPPRIFFERLRTVIEGMHERGISHGDIRRRNIMRGPNDQPYLIDFATAVNRRGNLLWMRSRLFTMLGKADHFGLAKLIGTYYPDLLTADDKARLKDVPWYLKTGRFLRKKVYRRFIKQKRWRERWTKLTGKSG